MCSGVDGGGPLLGTAGGFVADVNPRTTTSALDSDTDNDGFSDGQEDTNHNGAIDGAESDPNNAASTPQAVQKVPFIPGWGLVLLACVLTVMMARRQRGLGKSFGGHKMIVSVSHNSGTVG